MDGQIPKLGSENLAQLEADMAATRQGATNRVLENLKAQTGLHIVIVQPFLNADKSCREDKYIACTIAHGSPFSLNRGHVSL